MLLKMGTYFTFYLKINQYFQCFSTFLLIIQIEQEFPLGIGIQKRKTAPII